MKIIEPVSVVPGSILYEDFLLQPDSQQLLVEEAKRFQVSLVATNVDEDDYPEWSAAEAYEIGDKVVRASHCWECLADHSGSDPAAVHAEPPKWLDLGLTNRWRAFDDKVGTFTTNAEFISMSLALSTGIDSIGFFGVDAASVSVRVVDPFRGVVFEQTEVPVKTDGISNWYEYFFNEVESREDFVMLDIPRSPSGALEITLRKPAGIAKIGSLIVGRVADLGTAVYGTKIGIVDFSRKDRDRFGNTIIVQRDFSKRAEFDIRINTSRVGFVQRALAKWRARPVVWIGEQSIESTIILGYYRNFDISISGPSISDGTITVEGVN